MLEQKPVLALAPRQRQLPHKAGVKVCVSLCLLGFLPLTSCGHGIEFLNQDSIFIHNTYSITWRIMYLYIYTYVCVYVCVCVSGFSGLHRWITIHRYCLVILCISGSSDLSIIHLNWLAGLRGSHRGQVRRVVLVILLSWPTPIGFVQDRTTHPKSKL